MNLSRAFIELASAALSGAAHWEGCGCILIEFMVGSSLGLGIISLMLFFLSVGDQKWFTRRVERTGRWQVGRRSSRCRPTS